METLSFEWDRNKDRQNKRKHGIGFDEARTVFYDDHARLIPDPDHSIDEERFLLLGLSLVRRVLIVAHCYRESDSVIRIISARKATRRERVAYEDNVT